MRNRIGFHFGSASTASGWGDHIRTLDANGIPAVVMSVGGEGIGDIVERLDSGSQVDHIVVARCLSHNDVPLYDAPINAAVEDWLNRYVPTIGPEVKRYHQRIITKHGNELDRNKIQWLADFYTALHPAFLQPMGWQSHRICVFYFASGVPDPHDWESILPFLKLCGDNPDKFVIGIHEYSYDDLNIMNQYNWLVGRFQHLYAVCDKHKIKRPMIAIHEWGWRDIKIPTSLQQSLEDIDRAMEMYAYHAGERFLGAGIWTLQPWQNSNINQYVQQLIPHVTNLTLTSDYAVGPEPVHPGPVPPTPVPPTPVPPTPQPGSKVVVVKLPSFPEGDVALWQKAATWAYGNYRRTQTASADDMISLLASGNNESYALIVNPDTYPSQKVAIKELEENGYKWDSLWLDEVPVPPPQPPPPAIPPINHGDVVIDISYAQGNIDLDRIWTTGKIKRVIIRVSSGPQWSSTDPTGIDVQFWNNVDKCIRLNIPTELYFFAHRYEDYGDQINRFYGAAREAISRGLKVDAVAVDFEGDHSPQTESQLRAFCTLFKDQNNVCDNTVVYSGAWWWNPRVSASATWPQELGLQQWCAHYVNGDPLTTFPPTTFNFNRMNGFRRSDVRYWQFTSKGGLLVNHVSKNLDLNYYLDLSNPAPPPVPPPAQTVNVLPFIRGTDRVQFDLAYNGGTQTTQVRHYPTRFIYVKGDPGQYECLFVAPYNGQDWIWRAEDTSESATRFYAHYNGQGGPIGAPWFPCNAEVGRWYETGKFVQHYTKTLNPNGQWQGGCTPSNSGNVTDKIRLISAPYNRTYQQSGKTLRVITLEWSRGEQYDFCVEFGNVGFRDATRDFWFMEGPLLGRQDKTYQKPTCINVGW